MTDRYRCGRAVAQLPTPEERLAELEARVRRVAGDATPTIMAAARRRHENSVLTFPQAVERELEAWRAQR